MTAAEASRQYQDALEAERRTRTLFGDTVSAEAELADAEGETGRAYQQLRRAWTDQQIDRWNTNLIAQASAGATALGVAGRQLDALLEAPKPE